jgi:signal transduction histidine kinase
LLHGKPSRVQLEATTDNEGTTVLTIADDGAGTSLEKITAGVGSAIIDSWVAILMGVKEIDTMPDHGFRIQVTFPK